jgi:chemotaxis protein CheD
MIKVFNKYNISSESTEIKLFGGASVIGNNCNGSRAVSVGDNNIRTALQILKKAGLPVASSDTGGAIGRKLLFYTHTGEIYLKRLNRAMKQSR